MAFLLAIFAVGVYRAATRPVGTGEAYIYDRFVRPALRQVWAQELPDRDVLYALLEKRSIGLFHVSPISIRLPSLLFLALYLWSVRSLAQLFSAPFVLLAALAPLWWQGSATADGVGAAVALELVAMQFAVKYFKQNQSDNRYYLNLTGVCLGLAVAARLEFAGVSLSLALLLLAIQKDWFSWIDRVLIPAIVVSLIFLVLPMSHAHHVETTSNLAVPQAAAAQSALAMLRAEAGARPISVGASAPIEPIVNFDRAQYREIAWRRADRRLAADDFDFYLLTNADQDSLANLHLIVLYEDAGIVLARSSHDRL